MAVDAHTHEIKVAIRDAWTRSALTKVELASRLGCHESEVRRILDPGTMTKLPRLDQAARALGLRVVIGWEPSP